MILYLLGVALLVAFAAVVCVGAPYLPTLRQQVVVALDLIDLQPGQTLLELGCGDGRVLIAAAERGWRVVGIEINPFLAAVAWIRTRRYGDLVQIKLGSFWSVKWPASDGVFVFLLPRFMRRLDRKMQQYHGRLVSVAFAVPDRLPLRTKNSVFLYDYTT